MHMRAEDSLWEALQSAFLLNQAVAISALLRLGHPSSASLRQGSGAGRYRDRRISLDDLWSIAAPTARSDLRGTAFGTEAMREMWQSMDGVLSAEAQRYLDEVEAAAARDEIFPVVAMANCPYEPIYRTRRTLDLAGTTIPADTEFHWNFHRDEVESTRRFGRTGDWQECPEGDRSRHSSC
jgi:hypothetical protein